MTDEDARHWLEEIVRKPDLFDEADPKLAVARGLNVIPLRDGSWTSTKVGPVYWPTFEGASIPVDVELRIVQDAAVENPNHRRLFDSLGVQEVPVAEVRALILRKHHNSPRITPMTCKNHLRFLYLTHSQRRDDNDLRGISVFDQELRLVRPHVEDVYLPGIAPFDLLGHLPGNMKQEEGSVSFVHPLLLQNVPEQPTAGHPAWERWLCDFVGVQEQIKLVNEAGNDISDEFIEISQQQPQLILGILEHAWRSQGQLIADKPELQNKLKRLAVPSKSGELRPLWETYLPFPHLQKRCAEFMKPNEPFPFLDFGYQPPAEDLAGKWTFLYRELDVSKNDDLGFLLDILSYIQEANTNGLSVKRCRELVRLYCELEARCVESDEPESARDICRSFVEDIQGVAIPDMFFGSAALWTDPRSCLWDAPLYMTTKFPLRYIYDEVLLCDPAEFGTLSSFFHRTLCIPSMSWLDLAVELMSLRDNGCRDFGQVMKVYECLEMLTISGVEHKVRETFENEPLIFVPIDGQPTWVTRSQCLWGGHINIEGRVALDEYYPTMESFFVCTLGIDRLDVRMVYDQLLEMGLKTPPVTELREALSVFSSLLQETEEQPDPRLFWGSLLLPVKEVNGATAVVSVETEFVIIDRQHLVEPFAGRLRVLDFDLDGVLRLKPLLQWAGLENRCLSVVAKETTFVCDGPMRPISCPNRDIKTKAHALVRIAAAFNSLRYRRDGPSLCRLLESTQVIETDSISSIQTLIQDGKVVTSRTMKSELHLSDESTALVVYVPADKNAQDVCFATVLPGRLAEWLMGDSSIQKPDSAMVSLISSALHYDASVLDQILERQGIGQAPTPNVQSPSQAVHSICPWQTPPNSEPNLKSPMFDRRT